MAVSKEDSDFGNIFRGRTPEFVYEDEACAVFNEKYPQAPVHLVVVPKSIVSRLRLETDNDGKLLEHLLQVASNMALQNGLDRTGYHVRLEENYNNPKPRLIALHVFGRALHHMIWPTGPGCSL